MNLDDFLENDERREVQLLQLLLKAGDGAHFSISIYIQESI